jgi:hypothetical protein
MKIDIKKYDDGHEWEHIYYEWNAMQWLYHERGNENKSGMMIPFANAEYDRTRTNLTQEDKRAILKHFGLTSEQVSLDKLTKSSPQYLERIISH